MPGFNDYVKMFLGAGATVGYSAFRGLFDSPRDEATYKAQSFLGGMIRPLGDYYTYRDNTRYLEDYMGNRNLTYSDIKYPARTIGFGDSGRAVGSSLLYVSKNVGRMYK